MGTGTSLTGINSAPRWGPRPKLSGDAVKEEAIALRARAKGMERRMAGRT